MGSTVGSSTRSPGTGSRGFATWKPAPAQSWPC